MPHSSTSGGRGAAPQGARRVAARYGLPALVAGAVIVCFLPVLRCGFVSLDDRYNFGGQANFRGLSLQHLKWMFTTVHNGHYQPLSWMTHGAVYLVWGMDPFGYHLVNLLLHVANAVLFYFLTRVLVDEARSSTPPSTTLPVAAAVGALFFALHPLRVEAVAWVTERREVLSTFFLLLTVLAYVQNVRAERADDGAVRWLLASIGCYVLALLSKAIGMTLPVVLLVLDVYPLRRLMDADGRLQLRTSVLLEKLPYIALAAAAAAVAVLGVRQGAALTLANHSLTARMAQAAYGLCFYLWKTLFPAGLLPMYPLVLPLDPFQPKFIVSAAGVLVISALLVWWRRRYPWALAAWICYVVLVSPVLGFTQSGRQITADRYTYLPCMPWAVLVAAGIDRLWAIARERRLPPLPLSIAAAVIVTVLVVLGVRTFQQTHIWQNTYTLFDHVVRIEPTAQAYYYRCNEKYLQGDLAGALADIDAALRLEPQSPMAHLFRGRVRQAQGNADAAIAEYNALLRVNPYLGDAYTARAVARQSKGDTDGALADLDRASRLTPEDAEAAVDRGNLRFARGDIEGALADFTHAIAVAVDRGGAEAYYGRGNVRASRGDVNGAVADYAEALRLTPPGSAHRAALAHDLAAARQRLEQQRTQ